MSDRLSSYGIDWRDQSRRDSLVVALVSPSSLVGTDGVLQDVEYGNCSIDCNYYSDARTSARLRYRGDSWTRNRAVRIYHVVSDKGYYRPLGTFLVTRDDGEFRSGQWVGDLTCQSMLWGIGKRKLANPLTIRAGQDAHAAIRSLLSSCGRPYRDYATGSNSTFAADKIYESGKTYLEVIYDLADLGSYRVDVDGEGYVTIRNWPLPDLQSPTFTLDAEDPRGIMHDEISRSSDYGDLPSEVVIHCKYSVEVEEDTGEVYETDSGEHKAGDKKYKKVHEQRELNGTAQVLTGQQSAAQRGYHLTDYRTIGEEDLDPKTQAEVDRRAHQALARLPFETVSWQVKTQYFPVWEGDVGLLGLPSEAGATYRDRQKVLVKSVSLDLSTMQQTLVLQKTSSWNEEIYGQHEDGAYS